jgi:hypothetical protein
MEEFSWGDILPYLVVAAPAVAIIWACCRFTKALARKRAEFAAAYMERFFSCPRVRKATAMIDRYEREIELLPGKKVRVTDNMAMNALRTDKEIGPGVKFLPEEDTEIRLCFDALFSRMSVLHGYVKNGLVTANEIKPYLAFWSKILTGKEGAKSKEFTDRVWKYAEHYGHAGARELAEKLAKR